MIASGYNLTLYCDSGDACVRKKYSEQYSGPNKAEFNDELRSRCRTMARQSGWKFNLETGDVVCPACIRDAKKKLQG